MKSSTTPRPTRTKRLNTNGSASWVRFAVVLFVGLSLILLLYQLSEILKLVVISALLAYLLDPVATWLESYGFSRNMATFTVFTLFMMVVSVFLFFLFPVVLRQLGLLQTGEIIEQAEAVIADLEMRLAKPLSQVGIYDLDLIMSFRASLAGFFNESISYVPGMLSLLGNLVVVPFMLFLFIKDARSMKKGFIDAVPNQYFEFSLNVLQKMDKQLGNYLRGQFLVALIVGTLSTLALWLLGIDFFLVIGPIAGLMNMIPYVGPAAGGLLAIIASVITTGNFDTVPGIIITFSIIQLIDNTLLQPLVLARNVKLHPMLILIAILIGGKLFGIMGLLLAVPFAAIIKVILVETVVNLQRYQFS